MGGARCAGLKNSGNESSKEVVSEAVQGPRAGAAGNSQKAGSLEDRCERDMFGMLVDIKFAQYP